MHCSGHRDTIGMYWSVALAASLALMGAALADGMPEPRPVAPVPAYVAPALSAPWTGFYIGAHGGYAHTDVQFTSLAGSDVGGDGGGIGGHVGYNWQIHRFVLGIEGDGTGTWIDSSDGSCVRSTLNCSTHYHWLASLRGRAGLILDDKITLIYATAGVAWTDGDYAARNAAGAPAGRGFSEQHVGWVAGGGIEHVLSRHITGRIEYLYYGFDDASAPAGSLAAIPITISPNVQVVRVGVSFKF